MLYKQPEPIALKPIHSHENREGDFKRKWKRSLHDSMKKTKDLQYKEQVRYKKNDDKRLRKQYKTIHEMCTYNLGSNERTLRIIGTNSYWSPKDCIK